jgi:hypothetical protein
VAFDITRLQKHYEKKRASSQQKSKSNSKAVQVRELAVAEDVAVRGLERVLSKVFD